MLGTYLELARPANVATALADVLAGAAVAGLGHPSAVPWLLGATACLYAGGVILNDVFDRHLDAVERPERPLPSGRVPVGHAATLGGLLLTLGVVLAALATREALVVATCLAAAVLLYDAVTKKSPVFGPPNMGLCRGLNLALGMASVPGVVAASWLLCLLPTAYVAGVTVLSRGEVTGTRRSPATLSVALVAASALGLLVVTLSGPAPGWSSASAALLAAVFTWRVLPLFVAARRHPRPQAIRAAVKRGVLSLVLLDAALATAFAGPLYGLVLLAAALAAGRLARTFSVT